MEQIGKFDVLAPLGRGAGSTILKVRRKSDDRVYALKVINVLCADDKKYVEQAENEFEVGQQLKHPNLARIIAFEKSTRFFRLTGAKVLIEFVDGLPLSECSELPLLRLVKVFFKIADGLAYMHDKGFFHADLKPDNIMVSESGDVKVIDFGLVWREGDKKDRVQGTLEFLAPEQARKKVVNAKTDIFNFGATMYRVLTTKPVPAQLRDKETRSIGGGDTLVKPIPDVNPQVPEGLDELVRQCIRIDPASRPASMKEIRDRLRDVGKKMS